MRGTLVAERTYASDRPHGRGRACHPASGEVGHGSRYVQQAPRAVLKRGAPVVAALLLFLAGAGVVVRISATLAMRAYAVPASSMEPALHCARPSSGCQASASDRILVLHRAPFWTPRRGDIVVFRTPPEAERKCGAGGTFVKRIVALPGETWEQRAGSVYIDGSKLAEPYVQPAKRDTSTYPARRIPEGKYFLMGDNRYQSCDSREWGSVPRRNLEGPVVAIYWPFDRLGLT